ncbi:MAG TPA: efflux RND transporter permease subunit [Solirubrobacteraceae bacterium]|nr:efflux RND transporter permease subunit [Solirubrobacteraceae bacterium]
MRNVASWCFRHRWLALGGWVVGLVVLVGIHSAAHSAFTDNFKLPHTGSFDAIRLLQKASPHDSGETDQLVIGVDHGKVTDPAVVARAKQVFARVQQDPNVASVVSPFTPQTSHQIAPNGQVAFANVTFTNAANQNKVTAAQAQQFVKSITSHSGHGVQFQVEGNIAEAGNTNNQGSGLLIGFLAAAVVLFLVFGSFAAMMLPLITAGVSLGAGTAVVGVLSHAMNIATFSTELSLLIGLGVGVDYALFIVTRYKQAVMRGDSREAAVVEAIDTSGRAVLFAGLIVCIAMLGMFALGVSFLYGVAVAAAVTVAFTVLAALTLLPAMLAILGRWIPRRRERRALKEGRLTTRVESPAWVRWTDAMSRRPAVFATIAAAIMIIVAIPFFSMRLGSSDAGTDPSNTTTRKAYDLLAKGFGPGYNGPLELVAQVKSDADLATFKKTEQAVASTPGVVGSTGVSVVGGKGGRPKVAIASVYPKGSPQAASTSDLLAHVRSSVIPPVTQGTGLTVLVGGTTAIFEDFSHILSAKLPLFIGVVVVLSFLLLMAVFRSLVIPLTAAIMNMLSAGAAFGVITAVFQKGWLGGTTGPIEAFLPVLMFPILFGLSMDYEVFLISRVYEEWHRRRNNTEAVAHGLAATGRTIVAASAIMVLVFASFILGGERIIELFGVGLASAVLLDALLVRSVLVPALMILIGDANWKLPSWLNSSLPRLNVEGRSSPRGEVHGVPEPEPVAG